MKNNYNIARLTILIGCLALLPTASSENNLEISLVKYDDGLGGFLYGIAVSAEKVGATTFEFIIPSGTFDSFVVADDLFLLKDLSFSSLSSEIGGTWTLTWDKGLSTETVASIGIGTILEGEFLEVPTLTNPIDGATDVAPNTSIDWVYSVAPAVAQQDDVEVFGTGPGDLSIASNELPLDTASWTPPSALAQGEWEVFMINGRSSIREVADGIGGPITGDPWVLENEDWLGLVSIDVAIFTVVPNARPINMVPIFMILDEPGSE